MPAKLISGLIAAMSSLVLCTPIVAQAPPPDEDPGPLRMHHARVAHTATALADGSVLVAGGHDGVSFHRSAEVFDPEGRHFRRVGDLTMPRHGHQATALPDGRVLLTGGAIGANPRGTKSVEVYDPATATFSPLGRLQHPRYGHAATLLEDGRVLISGGLRGGDELRFRKSAEVFDPATGTSRTVDPMRTGRMSHVAVRLVDGRIAMIGGFGAGGAGERAVEVFVPARQRFRPRPDLAIPADRPAAARLEDGRVLVVSASGSSTVVSADARRSERVRGRSPRTGRATATLLDDGRVVVIAGVASGSTQVDVFDPATDTFTRADPLRSDRQEPVAVLLDDGSVVVVGGLVSGPGCLQVLDTAEIWDPRTMTTIAAGAETECDPSTMDEPPPLPSLGRTTTGGRIELPGSAFAITVPDDWSVELAEPDADVFTAEPGSAWEALRATAPDRSLACSVSVGVAEVSLRKRSGTGSGAVTTPRWESTRRWLLLVPTPRVEDSVTSFSSSSPIVRLAREHPGLEHDALYALECAGTAEDEDGVESIARTFEFLTAPG